jgi:hypothetical protein
MENNYVSTTPILHVDFTVPMIVGFVGMLLITRKGRTDVFYYAVRSNILSYVKEKRCLLLGDRLIFSLAILLRLFLKYPFPRQLKSDNLSG